MIVDRRVLYVQILSNPLEIFTPHCELFTMSYAVACGKGFNTPLKQDIRELPFPFSTPQVSSQVNLF